MQSPEKPDPTKPFLMGDSDDGDIRDTIFSGSMAISRPSTEI